MTTHELKTWPPYFGAVLSGRKPFEVRRDDRSFAVGDELVLREFWPNRQEYTGRECRRRVTYVLRGAEPFGMREGFVVLGLEESDHE